MHASPLIRLAGIDYTPLIHGDGIVKAAWSIAHAALNQDRPKFTYFHVLPLPAAGRMISVFEGDAPQVFDMMLHALDDLRGRL